jgi:hypothetical protein
VRINPSSDRDPNRTFPEKRSEASPFWPTCLVKVIVKSCIWTEVVIGENDCCRGSKTARHKLKSEHIVAYLRKARTVRTEKQILLGNDFVNTQQWSNCWKRCFLCRPCRGYITLTSCRYRSLETAVRREEVGVRWPPACEKWARGQRIVHSWKTLPSSAV